MAPIHPLPDALIELVAQRFRSLSEPTRLRILEQLRGGPATVQQLADTLGWSQQNVSKHLGVLLLAGIVAREKVATSSRYSIADPTVIRLCDEVCGAVQQQVAALHRSLETVTA